MKKGLLYFVVVLLACSCAKPISDFTLNSTTLVAPAMLELENNSKNAEQYKWDFGDGTTSDLENPNHTYILSGRYTVTLSAVKKGLINARSKEIIVEAPKDCKVLIRTNYGDMTLLLSDKTPMHRDNFIKLVNQDFYNGLLFHRVIEGFMIQGGDPDSKNASPDAALGSGGNNTTIPAEFETDLIHMKGALAAARNGDNVNPQKKSSGCQFYIVHGANVSEQSLDKIELQSGILYTDEQRAKYIENGGTPFLDHNYTVFGQVIEGLDVIDKIAGVKKNSMDRPTEDVLITEMTFIN